MSAQVSIQRRSWGLVKPVQVDLVDPENDSGLWLVHELRRRNFPEEYDIRTRPANTNILWSGLTQSGKSTSASKLIIGCRDERFLPSLAYHPVFTGDVETSWQCHLSVSPVPLFKALRHDLKIMRCDFTDKDKCQLVGKQKMHLGRKPRELPPGSWWQLDEPTDVDSLDYWQVVARAMGKFVTMFAFMGVNLVILAPIKDQVLKRLKSLSHLWIDQKKPGHAEVWSMVPWTDVKSKRREQYMKPIHQCSIVDEKQPPKEWLERYPQIKLYNAALTADDVVDDLTKKGYIS